MVEIFLDKKKDNDKYPGTNETVTISCANYISKEFKKITYTIEYIDKHGSFWGWWIKSYLFTVYIKNGRQTIFTYYASKELDVLFFVEVYHSVNHDNVPLILGLKNKYYTKYYTYHSLKGNYSYGFPDKGFETDRTEKELKKRLKNEDNRVNRIKFYNTGGSYKNCHVKTERIDTGQNHFIKICYNAEDKNRYEEHILTKDKLFGHEEGIDVDKSYLQSVHEKYFDVVCVYRTNEDTSRVLLLEFINGDKKNYFSRQDKYGYHWVQNQSIDTSNQERLSQQLEQIQNESNNKIAFLLTKKEGKYNNYNISVSNNYDARKRTNIYTHISSNKEKKALLLNNNSLISLEKTDEYTGSSKILKIQEVCYSALIVVWTDKKGLGINTEYPVLLELTKEDGRSKYTLRRIDDKGLKWMQISEQVEQLITNINSVSEKISYDIKKSIIVKLNEKGYYEMMLITNHEQGSGSKTDENKNIKIQPKTLSSSKYRYYEHDFSQSKTSSESNIIVGLRTYIANTEIKLYDTLNKKQDLNYSPTNDMSKYVEVYFYNNDNFPLALKYNNAFYIPNKKDEYLVKWVQKTGIYSSSDSGNLNKKLNEINTEFNEILLDTTGPQGYGITPPPGKQLPEGFDTKRVKVERTPANPSGQKFGKITHKTANKSSIGKIMMGKEELKDQTGTTTLVKALEKEDSGSVFVGVTAYYHKNDSGFKTPLLLGFAKTSSNRNEVFYERESVSDNSNWKKITVSDDLLPLKSGKPVETGNKVNNIHYNIGKSVKIRVDQQ